MPHGDLSDYGAAFCFLTGVSTLVAPKKVYFPYFFPGEATPELVGAIRVIGGLILMMWPILFVAASAPTKWGLRRRNRARRSIP